jgi:hypothetical protein
MGLGRATFGMEEVGCELGADCPYRHSRITPADMDFFAGCGYREVGQEMKNNWALNLRSTPRLDG